MGSFVQVAQQLRGDSGSNAWRQADLGKTAYNSPFRSDGIIVMDEVEGERVVREEVSSWL